MGNGELENMSEHLITFITATSLVEDLGPELEEIEPQLHNLCWSKSWNPALCN